MSLVPSNTKADKQEHEKYKQDKEGYLKKKEDRKTGKVKPEKTSEK